MDFLLILLGSLIALRGAIATNPPEKQSPAAAGKRTAPAWLGRLVFFVIGAVLIVLGILFRMHRYR